MSADQQPVRRPGGRRPIPPLIFLLVLAILALFVWWKVIRTDERTTAQNSTCTLSPSSDVVQQLSTLSSIKVHVLNGSQTKGLAGQIRDELAGRGFTVLDVGNASADQAVATEGQIQYGAKGAFAALVLSHELNGFELVPLNSIQDDTLTLIAGAKYNGMTDAAAATNAVKQEVDREAKIRAGCKPSQLPSVSMSTTSAAPSSSS